MKTLLIVFHSSQAVPARWQRRQREPRKPGRTFTRLLSAVDAQAADVLAADGYIFATPETLAAISGLMKDFFDRTYYAALERINGRPYASLICAGSDGQNAARQIERIATGWRLRAVAEPVIVCTHAQTPEAIFAPRPSIAATSLGARRSERRSRRVSQWACFEGSASRSRRIAAVAAALRHHLRERGFQHLSPRAGRGLRGTNVTLSERRAARGEGFEDGTSSGTASRVACLRGSPSAKALAAGGEKQRARTRPGDPDPSERKPDLAANVLRTDGDEHVAFARLFHRVIDMEASPRVPRAFHGENGSAARHAEPAAPVPNVVEPTPRRRPESCRSRDDRAFREDHVGR